MKSSELYEYDMDIIDDETIIQYVKLKKKILLYLNILMGVTFI